MRIDGGWRERIFSALMMAVGVLAGAWGCGGAVRAAPPAEFYVAPDGDDAAEGRLGRPVATLRWQAARLPLAVASCRCSAPPPYCSLLV